MKVLFILFLIFSAASTFGDSSNIRPSYSGAWHNPDQSGHGISVEVLDDERTIFFWHTFDQDGNPFWLLADGVNSEVHLTGMFIPYIRVEATAYFVEGMIWGEFDTAKKTVQEWGTIVLDFPYWECNRAHMEWYPAVQGFTEGATDLVRLSSPYRLDCVISPGPGGNWEVQFGFDADLKFPVEVVTVPDSSNDAPLEGMFEFIDETGCLWSGHIEYAGWYIFEVDWGNECSASTAHHSRYGKGYFEYRLCDSKSECVWKDEVMIFEDEGEYLIFSR